MINVIQVLVLKRGVSGKLTRKECHNSLVNGDANGGREPYLQCHRRTCLMHFAINEIAAWPSNENQGVQL
jgi:hypothetical protein